MRLVVSGLLPFFYFCAAVVSAVDANPKLQLTIRPLLLTAQAIEVEAGIGELSERPVSVYFALVSPDGQTIATEKVSVPKEASSIITRFKTTRLKSGTYQVLAKALRSDETVIAEMREAFEIPQMPKWWRSTRGIFEKVPKPWTPLKIQRIQNNAFVVECWGRKYRFDQSPMPSSILNQGKTMLAAPVRWRGELYGKEFEFQRWQTKCLNAKETEVVLVGESRFEDIDLQVRTTIEFDGLMRFDVRLNPNTHYITKLALEIPLRREWVKFVYHWPPGWPHIDGTFPLPKDGWQSPFYHYVWLGNESGGICWFTESEQPFVKGRVTGDEGRVIQVVPKKDTVVLRINFVQNATLPTFREWTVTFGLLPTPVKPWRKDYHRYLVGIDAGYGMEKEEFWVGSVLSYSALGNLNASQGTLEFWVQLGFEPTKDSAMLFAVGLYSPNYITLHWLHQLRWNQGAGLSLRVEWDRREEPIYIQVPLNWKKDEWHHIALTWGKAIALYVDGNLVAQKPFEGLLGRKVDLQSLSLSFGGSSSTFAIDELRISREVRASFNLSEPPDADESTLLLDRLEREDEVMVSRRTKPEVGTGGIVSDLAEFVAGRFGKCLRLTGKRYGISTFERFKQLGIKAVNLPEWWTQAQGTTETVHEERLKSFVSEAHKQGIKVLLYFGFEMGDAASEWKWLKYELAGREPQARVHLPIRSFGVQPQSYFGIDHGAQPYQDYLIEGIAHLIAKYDIDGVYLDGTHLAGGCANEYHGHGWFDEKGKERGISFIWSSRRLMKRMYQVIKSVKPDGIIYAHTSSVVLAPTISFADFFYNGEQLMELVPAARQQGYKPPAEIVPLTTFAVLFNGRPWGVPCHFHPGSLELNEALSISLLHDVFPAPYTPARELVEQIGKIRSVYEEFGADEAEWHPYFEKPALITAQPECVKVSFHRSRKDGKLLLVISNLSAKSVKAKVSLDLNRLKLSLPIKVFDALKKVQLQATDASFLIDIRPASFRLVLVW